MNYFGATQTLELCYERLNEMICDSSSLTRGFGFESIHKNAPVLTNFEKEFCRLLWFYSV